MVEHGSVQSREFLYISNADVRKLLSPADAVRIARETLLEHAEGAIDWAVPRQADLVVRDSPTRYKLKGCGLHRTGVAGFRVVGLNRTEQGYGLAAHRPTKHVLLSDPATGEFFAIVDERSAYALRTGACAAVAVELLRRPGSADCSIVGTGHMAYAAALTVNEVMPLDRIRVYSRNEERRRAFADRLARELGISVVATDGVESCIRDSSVVVTATEARDPIITHDWLSPGVVVYAMGSGQECDKDSYRHMRLIVDDREQVMICQEFRRWVDDGSYDPAMIEADLAEVVAGSAGKRLSDDDQYLVRSQGLVTQDVAQAWWIYEQARKRGFGVSLEDALPERPGDSLF